MDRSGVENPRGFTKMARTSIIKHLQNFLIKIVVMSLGFFEFRLSIFFEIHENGFSSPYPVSLSDGGGFLLINPRKGTETNFLGGHIKKIPMFPINKSPQGD